MLIEDLDIFLAGEFSDRALFVRTGLEVLGIFDERYEAIFEQYSSTASGRLITFLITSAEADDLRLRDRLTITSRFGYEASYPKADGNNKDYLIVSIEPTYDGKLTKLVLKHG